MNLLTLFCWILVAHWLADHVLQPRWAAKTKSHSWQALSAHISQYALCMALFMSLAPGINHLGLVWYLFINMVAHFVTDAITSRLSDHCYQQLTSNEPKLLPRATWEWLFWVIIGFDQLLHLLVLTLTIPLIY